MPTYVPGFQQSATINSTVFCVTNSTWTETNDVLDVTGSCSGGKKQYIAGLSGVSGSFDLNVDLLNPVNVAAGAFFSVSNIIGTSGTQGLTCSTCIVTDRAYTFPVPGVCTVTISYNTSGPYTIATT